MFDNHTLCTSLNFHICSLTGTNDFRRQPCITPLCGQQPIHSPGNGLFETLISPIQRKTSLLYTYTALILAQPIFETLVFVITIQKYPSEPSVSSHPLMHFPQIQPKRRLPHPSRNSSLRDASIIFIQRLNPSRIHLYISSIGSTSL